MNLKINFLVLIILTFFLFMESSSYDDSLNIQDDDPLINKKNRFQDNNEEFDHQQFINSREINYNKQEVHPGMNHVNKGHPGMQMDQTNRRSENQGNHRNRRNERGGIGINGNPEMGDQRDGAHLMENENGEYNQKQQGFDNYLLSNYEIGLILFFLIFIFNIFIGKARNYKFAKKWYFSNKQYLFQNYSHIGVIIDKKKEAIALMKDSYNTYKVYSSGRINCKWLMCTLEFKRRHDLILQFLGMFYSDEDKINYEVSLDYDLQTVFCFCRKTDISMLRKNYSDIDFFTKVYEPKYITKNYNLLAENKEIFDEIIQSKDIINLFKKIENQIIVIFFTDRKLTYKQDNVLYFSFKNDMKNQDLYSDITQFVHLFFDHLCMYKMSHNFKKEAETRRNEFEKLKLKEKLKEEIKNPDHKIFTKKKGK